MNIIVRASIASRDKVFFIRDLNQNIFFTHLEKILKIYIFVAVFKAFLPM